MTDCAETFSDARVLVTGAGGFIGSHLCQRLAALGARVHAVSRTEHKNAQNLRWWIADLTDAGATQRIIEEVLPHYVFHLAGWVYGSRDLETVLPAFRANVVTTVNLLTSTAASDCRRFVLAGSLEEPEATNLHPVPTSPYAVSKFAATTYLRFFHSLYAFPAVVARIFMVYGPAQRDLQKLIPYVTRSLLRNESPQLSSGSRQVDWIYVDDVIEGLLALAQEGNDGETVDLGSGELISIRELVETLASIIDSKAAPRFGAIDDRPMEQVRVASVEETRRRIGWQPMVSLQEGLARTVEWYRHGGVGPQRT